MGWKQSGVKDKMSVKERRCVCARERGVCVCVCARERDMYVSV